MTPLSSEAMLYIHAVVKKQVEKGLQEAKGPDAVKRLHFELEQSKAEDQKLRREVDKLRNTVDVLELTITSEQVTCPFSST